MFLEHGTVPVLTRPITPGFLVVKSHRPLELGRPNARVDLRGVDTCMPEQCSDLLEIVMAFQDLHRHAVP
jgi:hypothetical protein